MIAVITPSGAFLYEMSENESDVCAEPKGFLDDKAADRVVGWLFITKDMPYQILKLGISICYVDIDSMRTVPKGVNDYMKVGVKSLLDIWNQLYPIGKRIRPKEMTK